MDSIESVKDYYGKVLKTNDDLKTSACCIGDETPDYLKPIISQIHDDVMAKFYGCGSPIPPKLEGKTVLDLGSGSGKDCFVLSKLVGESGKVIGVDMTDEQLQTAREYIGYHADKFGFKKPNVEFKQGYIEDLETVGVASNSVDVVVSNCVINLSPNKERVFKEIFRVLKPGGELYFSDVFSDRRISLELQKDPVLLGECLSGAMYFEDFRRVLAENGCKDYRFLENRKMDINDKVIAAKLGAIQFYSATVRAFKMDLEDRCEDYGQVAYYLGGLEESPNKFILDDHHVFEKNKPMLVRKNTADMIKQSRFSDLFKVEGEATQHFGLFDCAPIAETSSSNTSADTGACC